MYKINYSNKKLKLRYIKLLQLSAIAQIAVVSTTGLLTARARAHTHA
jgi:hypothetical protein